MPGRFPLRRIAAFAAGLALAGCSRDLTSVLAPNRAPEVKIHGTAEPSTPDVFAWRIRWSGTDADGRVSHYLVALDPASVDRVDASWQRVESTDQVVSFPTRSALRRLAGLSTYRPHVLVVRAVDDRGEISDPAWFPFGEGNIPPSVQILNPRPSSIFTPIVPPIVTVRWDGDDPDGVFTQKPVKYKYRLFTRFNPDRPDLPDFIAWARAHPDSLRAIYAPKFATWDSVSGDTTDVTFSGLNPGQTYLFTLTGFDEAGEYDPVFSFDKNLLAFQVTSSPFVGPVITMFNESFTYRYLNGGFHTSPDRVVRVSQPAGQPITFHWFAEPPLGDVMNAYRWVLDPVDLFDETPRVDPNDLSHWSEWSLAVNSATVGPFAESSGAHRLYLEARSANGFISLGILEFGVVAASHEKNLLVVDDTRLSPDMFVGGMLEAPRGPWPSAAELDTFLYAIGGFPWQGYPAGTHSPDGIISHAYGYDTLGTRGLGVGQRRAVIGAGILGQYRHVIWLTDQLGATYTGNAADPVRPITMLRRMTAPGQTNELATYVETGGKLWMAGGGAAYASLIHWNKSGTASDDYSAANQELVPGRMMYDQSHWRSRIRMADATLARRTQAPGLGWPGQPDYTLFPEILNRRSAATDPVPPLRTSSNFYPASFSSEHLLEPNEILEGGASPLDTIAEVLIAGTYYPAMTYYHGAENGSVVFSGFDLWSFRRTQCKQMVDFVLQQIWGMPAPGPTQVPRRGPTRVTRAGTDAAVARR